MTDQEQNRSAYVPDFLVGLGPDVPCDVVTVRSDNGNFRIQCLPHHCEMLETRVELASAHEDFLCDQGRKWMFIVHQGDDAPLPVMADLSGLRQQLLYCAQTDGGWDDLVVWRYTLDGACRAATVIVDEAEPVITVEDDDDGTVYLTVTLEAP